MNYLEIDSAIIAVTQKVCDECKARLDAIPKENTTERKAVQIEYGMYNASSGISRPTEEVTRLILKRQRFFHNLMHKYPKASAVYQSLDDEGKLCFIAALHSELYIREEWLGARIAELDAAKAAQDTKGVFELSIKIGAIKNMYAAIEKWRTENNIFPQMFEDGWE